jgi:hypothetical protein
MENTRTLNHRYSAVGESILLIWWGIVVLVGPLTIGMGAIGTGLILLGLNAARLLNRVPTRSMTTTLGLIALVWGALDTVLNTTLGAGFAMLLVVIGAVVLIRQLARIAIPGGPSTQQA